MDQSGECESYKATTRVEEPCYNRCEEFETFNPEVEYIKFLRRKPIIQTAKLYEEIATRDTIKCPYNFRGYGVEKESNSMYRTTSSEYGYYAPNAYTIPTRYFPLSQKFTSEINRFGMYRDCSLNMRKDQEYF